MADAGYGVSATQIGQWLGRVESQLQTIVVADNPFVTQAAQHVLLAGGKRLRPLLVNLGSQLGNRPVDAQRLIAAALVVELTHVASLYHDDVMDDAEMRRGMPSANAHFGNSVAILTGDYLFARASSLVAFLGPDFVQRQADKHAAVLLY